MPSKPSFTQNFDYHEYSLSERRHLNNLLINCEEYKEQTLLGPDKTTNEKGPCILVEDHPFHNPYYPRGPKKFTIQQVVYIVKHGVLPDNTKTRNTKYQIDLSHACHRNNCINIGDRHFVAEEHWKNDRRRQHLIKITSLFKNICKQILEIAKSGCKRMLRTKTKEKAFIRCIECDLCKDCDPPCFKNFNSCCSSLLTESK